jgi:Protein of unknown function (DUF1275)
MVSESNEAAYGTRQDFPENDVSTTGAPALLKPEVTASPRKRLKLRMKLDVEPNRTQLILLGLFFVTGLVDGAAYNVYSCFVSMQTGWSSRFRYLNRT